MKELAERIVKGAEEKGTNFIVIGEYHSSHFAKELYLAVIDELIARGREVVCLLEIDWHEGEETIEDAFKRQFGRRSSYAGWPSEEIKRELEEYLYLVKELKRRKVIIYGVDKVHAGERRAEEVRREIGEILEKHEKDVVYVALFGNSHVPKQVIVSDYTDYLGKRAKLEENPNCFYKGKAFRVLVLKNSMEYAGVPKNLPELPHHLRELLEKIIDYVIMEKSQRCAFYSMLGRAGIWKSKG